MSTPEDKSSSSKSQSCDPSNNQEGTGKSIKGSGSAQPKNEREGRWCSASLSNHAVEDQKRQINDNKNIICSDTSICSVELEDLPWQQSNLGEYKQLSLLKLTPMHKQSCDRTSQEYQFTQISETITSRGDKTPKR